MSTTAASSPVLHRVRGTLALLPRADGLDIHVREDVLNLHQYPRPCPADLRLASWDVGGATPVALLIRVARKPLLTFQTWINPMDARDNQALTALSGTGNVVVHVVTERETRSIQVPNVVRRDALTIAQRIRTAEQTWSAEQFRAACSDLDGQYPTASGLYSTLAGC